MNRRMILNDGVYILRAPEPDDLQHLYKMENDTELWEISNNQVPYSRYQLNKYISESAHDIYTDRQVRFIIERMEDGEVMGCIDLTDINISNGRAEVGIAVFPEYRNNGVGSAALEILCSYAERVLGLRQLFGFVPANNLPSLNLFINSGFQKTGQLKEWIRSYDRYCDVVVVQKIFEKKL